MRKHALARRIALSTTLVLFSAGGMAGAAPAQAATFNNSYDGQDSFTLSGSTTLKYTNGHAPFNENIHADAGTVSGSRPNWKYTIKMYNGSGQQVWSAANQTQRTYYTGSNVTKIVITPNSGYVGVGVTWSRV